MNMMHNLFGGSPQMPPFLGNMMNWFGKLQQFAKNPVASIMGMRNVNVPQDFNGGPKELVNYLVSTGQMPKEQFEQFGQAATQMQNMLPKF